MTKAALIISVCLLMSAAIADARRQTTSRTRLKATTEAPAATAVNDITVSDTLVNDIQDISIAGYDKPTTATKETFFVVNNTGRTLTELTVTFTYLDMQGRQLHQATHTVRCDIPPHSTRMLAVPSWDRQRSFHYRLSATGRKASTPYEVTHRIERVIASPL